MKLIKVLLENWQSILILAIVAIFIIYIVVKFLTMPREEQIQKVQEWLLWAVTQAERIFGGGTGKIKLRYVYDLFIKRFPDIAKIISFTMFSALVDKALETFNQLLSSNKALEEYVNTEEKVNEQISQ